jgi:hypothetical protein
MKETTLWKLQKSFIIQGIDFVFSDILISPTSVIFAIIDDGSFNKDLSKFFLAS